MSGFSLADLCDLAEVTPRTVRYYIVQGLLRPPAGAGPAARYDADHLYRLRLIRMLQREHLPLAEIRARLESLTDADVERLATEVAPATDSAADYVARVLGTRGVLPSGSVPRTTAHDRDALVLPSSAPGEPALLALPVTTAPSTAAEPVRSQWERFALAPDVELHIRRPSSRHLNRRIDRLLEAAREIFKEDQR